MRTLLVLVLVLAGCGPTPTASPDEAPATVAAVDPCAEPVAELRTLASRLDVGLTLEQYLDALGAAKAVVDASGCDAVEEALGHHLAAADRWRECQATVGGCSDARIARIRVDWDAAAAALP
jgi:hypothetical protein